MHADEIMYLFTMPIPHNETEIELSKKMLQIWTNFAKYGFVRKCENNWCWYVAKFPNIYGWYVSNPTPSEVQMMDGIPNWPAYTDEKKEFMAINRHWQVRNDYPRVWNNQFR